MVLCYFKGNTLINDWSLPCDPHCGVPQPSSRSSLIKTPVGWRLKTRVSFVQRGADKKKFVACAAVAAHTDHDHTKRARIKSQFKSTAVGGVCHCDWQASKMTQGNCLRGGQPKKIIQFFSYSPTGRTIYEYEYERVRRWICRYWMGSATVHKTEQGYTSVIRLSPGAESFFIGDILYVDMNEWS